MLTHAVCALQETEGGRETRLTSICSLMKLLVEFLCLSLLAPTATSAGRPFDVSLPVTASALNFDMYQTSIRNQLVNGCMSLCKLVVFL